MEKWFERIFSNVRVKVWIKTFPGKIIKFLKRILSGLKLVSMEIGYTDSDIYIYIYLSLEHGSRLESLDLYNSTIM